MALLFTGVVRTRWILGDSALTPARWNDEAMEMADGLLAALLVVGSTPFLEMGTGEFTKGIDASMVWTESERFDVLGILFESVGGFDALGVWGVKSEEIFRVWSESPGAVGFKSTKEDGTSGVWFDSNDRQGASRVWLESTWLVVSSYKRLESSTSTSVTRSRLIWI